MSETHFEIIEKIALISKKGSWNLELNRVSWNDNPTKLDLRSWDSSHEKCSKGISLTEEEAKALMQVLETLIYV